MKYLAATFIIFFWGILTLLLAVTIVGLIVLCEEDYFQIPLKAMSVFESKN